MRKDEAIATSDILASDVGAILALQFEFQIFQLHSLVSF